MKGEEGIGGEQSHNKECCSHQELPKSKKNSPQTQRECGLADTLIIDFWPPKPFENKTLFLISYQIRANLLWQSERLIYLINILSFHVTHYTMK